MASHPIHRDISHNVAEARDDGRLYVSSSQARENLADLLNRAAYRGERFIVDRHGKPLAAIVPVEDLDSLEEFEDIADLKAIREMKKDAEYVDWEDAKDELS
jgi:prevent-host-death family protein